MCTRGRNGRDGKAEYYYVEEEYNNIFIFCVSTCDDNNPFSVSSVFRFVRFIYNIADGRKTIGMDLLPSLDSCLTRVHATAIIKNNSNNLDNYLTHK